MTSYVNLLRRKKMVYQIVYETERVDKCSSKRVFELTKFLVDATGYVIWMVISNI